MSNLAASASAMDAVKHSVGLGGNDKTQEVKLPQDGKQSQSGSIMDTISDKMSSVTGSGRDNSQIAEGDKVGGSASKDPLHSPSAVEKAPDAHISDYLRSQYHSRAGEATETADKTT